MGLRASTLVNSDSPHQVANNVYRLRCSSTPAQQPPEWFLPGPCHRGMFIIRIFFRRVTPLPGCPLSTRCLPRDHDFAFLPYGSPLPNSVNANAQTSSQGRISACIIDVMPRMVHLPPKLQLFKFTYDSLGGFAGMSQRPAGR